MNNEILKLVRIKDDKLYYDILFNSLKDNEKNEILSQVKDRRKLSRINKKLEEIKFISLVKNKYDEKLEQYISQIQSQICPTYCAYRNIHRIISMLMDILDISDPTFVSFVIKQIMNKICKCKRVGQIQRSM